MTKPVITICSSAVFYRQALAVQDQLNKLDCEILVPDTATLMKESGDFEVDHYKTWFTDGRDYGKRAQIVRAHFAKIEKSDAILVVNHEKHGVRGYIGGNVLMEMSLAFWLNKPIFIMNEIHEASPFEEEIKCMAPIVLHGDISFLPYHIMQQRR